MAKSTDTAGGNLGRLASAAGSRNMGGAKPKRLAAKKSAPAKKVAKKSGSTTSKVKKFNVNGIRELDNDYGQPYMRGETIGKTSARPGSRAAKKIVKNNKEKYYHYEDFYVSGKKYDRNRPNDGGQRPTWADDGMPKSNKPKAATVTGIKSGSRIKTQTSAKNRKLWGKYSSLSKEDLIRIRAESNLSNSRWNKTKNKATSSKFKRGN
jgi:hypothetical protein